jgi:hypothetical protein
MLRALWSSLQGLFGFLGQSWAEGGEPPLSDLGHEMDPDG